MLSKEKPRIMLCEVKVSCLYSVSEVFICYVESVSKK